jgi:hypothetical protein
VIFLTISIGHRYIVPNSRAMTCRGLTSKSLELSGAERGVQKSWISVGGIVDDRMMGCDFSHD